MDITSPLKWRYATKKFDPAKKISDEQLGKLKEVMHLSPSSFGLQPWKFLIVQNPEIRSKLMPVAWNQPQITDASHLVVLCARKNWSQENVDMFINEVARQRNIDIQALSEYKNMISGFVAGHDQEFLANWAKRQAYIALGFLLYAAAMEQIDACPMEGFNNTEFDNILNLANTDFASTVLCALGFRSNDDTTANYKKVRFDQNEIFETI